jgi:NAD(P)-dependent dehydrogenase (short-subunit alcohol dehydrogenase family)
MGTNHLGHFALTCLLGDKIKDRVISVVSATYAFGRIHFDDLNWHARMYSKWAAYGQSKLAIMLFIRELARRGVRAYAADPGMTETDIARDSTGYQGWAYRRNLSGFYLHTPAQGARATLQAVTTDLPSGTYLAPRFSQLLGKPKVTKPRKKARDPKTARRLWEVSTELTGCDWPGRVPVVS